jgi:hypothetical protein
MAKWMNKMGLAAINFNIDDSKIAGFNKGFVDSREGSPVIMPRMMITTSLTSQSVRHAHMSSTGNSEYESDRESTVSWQQDVSQHSNTADLKRLKRQVNLVRLTSIDNYHGRKLSYYA